MIASIYNAWSKLQDPHTETCGWEELKKFGASFNEIHDKMVGGHWNWDDATAKAQHDFTVAHFGTDGRYTFS